MPSDLRELHCFQPQPHDSHEWQLEFERLHCPGHETEPAGSDPRRMDYAYIPTFYDGAPRG